MITIKRVGTSLDPLHKFHMSVLAPTVPGLPNITLHKDTVPDPDRLMVSEIDPGYRTSMKSKNLENLAMLSKVHDDIHFGCHGSMGRVTLPLTILFFMRITVIFIESGHLQNIHGNPAMPQIYWI